MRVEPGLRETAAWRLFLVCIGVVISIYAFGSLRNGWMPHDPGALGQSAIRVLEGQLPHRDYDEIYTGGLTFLNAAAFHWLGASIFTLRLVLFAVFLVWLPAVYYIARRVAPRAGAVCATLLAAAWGIPAYPAALPSWYNLFLATFGIAAMIRSQDTGQRRWLLLAGICGGLSCLIKIVGVYYIGAILLYLLYIEQEQPTTERASRTHQGTWLVIGSQVALVVALVALTWQLRSVSTFIHFVVPGVSLAFVIGVHEWMWNHPPLPARLRFFARLAIPFGLGVLAPIALFLIPYVVTGSVRALLTGVFVLPARRLVSAAFIRHDEFDLALAYGTILVALLAWRMVRPASRPASVVMLWGVALGVPLAAGSVPVYRLYWIFMYALVPLLCVWGAWQLLRQRTVREPSRTCLVFLLVAAAGLCSLVQFPFNAPVYFFYTGPLAALAGLALLTGKSRDLRILGGAIAASYTVFAITSIHGSSLGTMGVYRKARDQTHLLALERGGVLVSAEDSAQYATVVRLVRAHAPSGYTYATPDCPEIYFLSGLRNPTRTIFDMFDAPAGRTQRILRALRIHDVNAVVINQRPLFSGVVPPELVESLSRLYPHARRVGKFVFLWRE